MSSILSNFHERSRVTMLCFEKHRDSREIRPGIIVRWGRTEDSEGQREVEDLAQAASSNASSRAVNRFLHSAQRRATAPRRWVFNEEPLVDETLDPITRQITNDGSRWETRLNFITHLASLSKTSFQTAIFNRLRTNDFILARSIARTSLIRKYRAIGKKRD